MNNFLTNESIGFGEYALLNSYANEKKRDTDIVDYALLDTMHETKNVRYGKPYKKRELEPSMYELLSGGYVRPQNACPRACPVQDLDDLTPQEK